jgi:selenide,water dikinase
LRALDDVFDRSAYPDVLVGLSEPDDAAVLDLGQGRALILTTDFFTPVVDEPYDFGAIAAANALSDVYAMGGDPVLALNLVAFPPQLSAATLAELLRGGAEVVRSAGAVIAGGHSIQDKEPKYGLCVVGFGETSRLLKKGGAQAGDALFLTKPLGTGVVTTALKRGIASGNEVSVAVASMKRLNRAASRAALAAGAKAATDVTGFGLLGHALEMAEASGVRFRFEWKALPWLPGALRLAGEMVFPGGAFNNLEHFGGRLTRVRKLTDGEAMLLADPQTSGGLLVAVPAAGMAEFTGSIGRAGEEAWLVGEVVDGAGLDIV